MNTHPEKWHIPLTPENYDEVKAWWVKQVEKSGWSGRRLYSSHIVLSKHPSDESHYWSRCESSLNTVCPSYQKITLEQFRAITNPLPELWYIEATEENIDELNHWRLSKRPIEAKHWDFRFVPGATLLSKHPVDDSYFWAKDCASFIDQRLPEYKPITLEQFRQITTPTPKPMTKSIQISRDLLNEYYEAATGPQKAYLTEHFKLDGTTTDEAIRELHQMACDTWKPRIKKNHPECFPDDSKYFDFSNYLKEHGYGGLVSHDIADLLGIRSNFIQIRKSENPKTHARSFYLRTDYNWELVQEESVFGETAWVLIPTKKQS